MKAHLLDLNARLLLRANFSRFKQNLKTLGWTSYSKDYLFCCYTAVNLCNFDRCGCIQYVNTVCYVNWMSVCMYLSVFFCIFSFSPDLGQSIFYTTTCLLPFLSDDILSTLPYTMISTLATFPPFLHKDIIEYLSTSFLPMAICEHTQIKYLYPHRISKNITFTIITVHFLCLQWVLLGGKEEYPLTLIYLHPRCLWSPCSTPQIQCITANYWSV